MQPIVEITWLDAAFKLDEDSEVIDSWLETGGEQASTVGYLYKETSKCVIVCSEVFEDGTCRGFTVIPVGMIVKIKRLEEITYGN